MTLILKQLIYKYWDRTLDAQVLDRILMFETTRDMKPEPQEFSVSSEGNFIVITNWLEEPSFF